MKEDRKGRLERYLLNADPFLWGICSPQGRSNKSETYAWLKPRVRKAWPALGGFSDRATYEDVARLLVSSPGIENLTRDLIIPAVMDLPVGRIVDDLRLRWMAGRYPGNDFLKERGLEHQGWPFLLEQPYPFPRENLTKYVAGWSQFAGVWFEEIEHLDD